MPDNQIKTLLRRDIASIRVILEECDKESLREAYRELQRLTKQVGDRLEKKVK